MAAYDGSIRIDTRVDAKGFNQGIRGLSSGLGKLAAAVAAAFSIGAVVAFGKSALDASSRLEAALIGLQSVVNGTGGSFSQAKKFLEDFVADGLIPMADAATAYKNLAARGYNTDQIARTLMALKNSAAFGRQASLSMGQAVKGATEGLKNENSILVDNAGVTKNVSKMWQEYARSIGKTVETLTQQEKIQAEVNGILAETRFQVGDAARMSETYAGQVAKLGASWERFKAAVGEALQPIMMRILPMVSAVIDKLIQFANLFGQVTRYLFGGSEQTQMGQAAADTEAATAAQDALTESTKDAGKAAKGALAAFDELNVLARPEEQQQQATETQAATSLQVKLEPVLPEEISPELKAKLDAFREKLANLFAPLAGPLADLQKTMSPIWGWLSEKVLTPLGNWVMNDALPAFLDLVGAGLDLLNTVLIALQPLWVWFYDNVLAPAAAKAGEWLVEGMDRMTAKIKEFNKTLKEDPEQVQRWGEEMQTWSDVLLFLSLGPLGATIVMVKNLAKSIAEFGLSWDAVKDFSSDTWKEIELVWSRVWPWFRDSVIDPILKRFGTSWEEIKKSISDGWERAKARWTGAGAWFEENVTKPISKWFSELPAKIECFFKDAFTKATGAWSNIDTWFKTNVTEKLQNAWTKVTDWIKSEWERVLPGLGGVVTSAFNSVIDLINTFLSGFADGINTVVEALNALQFTAPDWVPGIGGQSWGVNLPLAQATQIPHLATGAVIPPNAEFAAILGDQRSGRNLEAPEGLIRQIIQEEVGKVQADIRIEFGGSLGELVRTLRPELVREDVRIGGSLVKGMERR
ncbi:MAG: hypothetical protein ACKOC5_08805 [Chloroflexota bacterium]